MPGVDDFKRALGADHVLPVTPLTVYELCQRIVRLEDALRTIASCRDCIHADTAVDALGEAPSSEHAVRIVLAHGVGCANCRQMQDVAFDAIAATRNRARGGGCVTERL